MYRERQRLADIQAAIDAIRSHLQRGDLSDGLVFDAVRIRLLEIGEAVKALPAEVLSSQPGIPWSQIARMRDHLAHRYFGVDPAERGGGLGRLLYETFFRAAQARGCVLVRAVTSPVNRGSVAFHQRMGFQLEPGDAQVDGIPVSSGYDGHGGDRVRFIRNLRSA